MIIAIHHIQLAMPEGREDSARAFYGGLLGLAECAKPPELAGRGGVWFQSGTVRVHLGVETPFSPAKKAHPAFQVENLAAAIQRMDAQPHPFSRDVDIAGTRRIFINDPFGNRIELLELVADQ